MALVEKWEYGKLHLVDVTAQREVTTGRVLKKRTAVPTPVIVAVLVHGEGRIDVREVVSDIEAMNSVGSVGWRVDFAFQRASTSPEWLRDAVSAHGEPGGHRTHFMRRRLA
jgi:hypothetical protein